jgi:hypothetical protein
MFFIITLLLGGTLSLGFVARASLLVMGFVLLIGSLTVAHRAH